MDARLIFRDCSGSVITKRGRRRIAETALLDMGLTHFKEDPAGKSTGSVQSHSEGWVNRRQPGKVRDFTLPRKSAKEFPKQPYLKPTQVDEVNIHRRLREHSLRN